MLSNIANLVVVCSKCLEGQIFPWLAVQTYRSPGIAQMLPEGIEGQEQIGQEIQQGIYTDFQDSVERRHHSTISFRIRWKRKAA